MNTFCDVSKRHDCSQDGRGFSDFDWVSRAVGAEQQSMKQQMGNTNTDTASRGDRTCLSSSWPPGLAPGTPGWRDIRAGY